MLFFDDGSVCYTWLIIIRGTIIICNTLITPDTLTRIVDSKIDNFLLLTTWYCIGHWHSKVCSLHWIIYCSFSVFLTDHITIWHHTLTHFCRWYQLWIEYVSRPPMVSWYVKARFTGYNSKQHDHDHDHGWMENSIDQNFQLSISIQIWKDK